MPSRAAIGSVRKRLVAVVSTSRSPAPRWRSTSSNDAAPSRGAIDVATKRSRSGAHCRRRAAGERRRVEGAELGGGDRAARVALGDVAVARREVVAIEHALVDQELAPQHVAVAGEQRVVEVEQRQPGRCRSGAPSPLKPSAGARPCGRVKAWMP